jgi:APA family basic amino acid/polyamine antiporter
MRVSRSQPRRVRNAWSYWIAAWAGNAAIAVGWVLYVEVFVNIGRVRLWSILLVLAGLWMPAH